MSISERRPHNLSALLAAGSRNLRELFDYRKFEWINTREDVECLLALFDENREEFPEDDYRRFARAFIHAANSKGFGYVVAGRLSTC